MKAVRTNRKGFTLVEILIVVIILGILAAIVIPQFTSATNDARNNSARSLQNTIRSQLGLYRMQHNDQLPDTLIGSTPVWDKMVGMTNADHTTTGTPVLGPYLQSTPSNPLNNLSTIAVVTSDTANPSAAVGFIINSSNGKVWVANAAGTARLTP
jgi:general secretion pathway protein G